LADTYRTHTVLYSVFKKNAQTQRNATQRNASSNQSTHQSIMLNASAFQCTSSGRDALVESHRCKKEGNEKQECASGEIMVDDGSTILKKTDLATSSRTATMATTTGGGNSEFGWSPTGVWWRDLLFFCGPGWLVSIAYVDPGNYQADIQAGATTRYYLLFTVWWASILSIYVQVLCVRLGYRCKMSLSEVQAFEYNSEGAKWKVYVAWIIAEFSVIITDLPEVIGFGIALNIFFGLAYWIGILLSLVTTMLFLATQRFGIQTLEIIIFALVGVMSIALFVELGFIHPDVKEMVEGWVYGFIDVKPDDIFAIVGIIGAVCMPHNLYLHSGTCQERKINISDGPATMDLVVKYCSWEPVVPIIVSFFVNMAILSIAAESVYGTPNAAAVGVTDFCNYFSSLQGGCILWGVALLAAGQSSAITTTYSGQFVMDGFLNMRMNVHVRAIGTRLIAILPCVLVAALLPNYLNQIINWVNAGLAILLPFALSPLIKYNCSEAVMGEFATKGWEKYMMYTLGIFVYLVNAVTISTPGGGFFGDYTQSLENGSSRKIGIIILEVIIQSLYFWWNCMSLFKPIKMNDDSDSLSALAIKERENNTIEEENKMENKNGCNIEDEQEKQEMAIVEEDNKGGDDISM